MESTTNEAKTIRDVYKTLKSQVEFILQVYPETRNSDKLLTWYIWDCIYEVIGKTPLGAEFIREELFMKAPSEDNIKRIRAYFNNKEKKYLPTDPKVLKARGILEKEWYKESLTGFNGI